MLRIVLLLCLKFYISTADLPTVSISSSKYYLVRLKPGGIDCSVINAASMKWIKTASAIIITTSAKYSVGTLPSPRLTINNVNASDDGVYSCCGINTFGTLCDNTTVQSGFSPTVSIKYNYYYGEIGQSFTIPCVTGDSFAVQWQIVSSSGTQVINLASAKYTGGTFTTPSLTITNILSSDGGDYQCCGTNVYGQSCDQTTLIPGNQPALSRNLKTVIAKISTNVVLGVTITSSTPALLSVYWKKDSQYIYGNRYNGGTTNISSLTINNVVATDDGTYTCTIYNGVGTASVDMNLFTWNTPSVFFNGNQNVAVGSVAVIQCRITSKPDVKRITWKKETVPINFSNDTKYQTSGSLTNPELKIFDVQEADKGSFSCAAYNGYDTGTSIVEINVGEITEAIILNEYYVTKEGEEITLECLIKNESSNIKLYWLKDAINVNLYLTNKYSHGTLNQPSLTIKNIETSDAGNYTCKLANLYGLSEDVVVLTVLFVQVAPPLHLSPNANESVFLPCEASGGNRVIWRRNGEEITTTGSLEYSGGTVIKPSLTISNVTRYHAGNYTCDTSYGSVTATSDTQLQLSVKDIPLVLISSNKIQASTGIDIQLGCYYESYPEPSLVFWNKDGGNLNVSVSKYNGSTIQKPSLTIINTNQLDAGIYVCAVVNEIGTGYSRKIQLIIKEKQKQQKYENKVPVIIGTSLSVTVFLLILFIVILLFIRSRRVKKRQESTYQTNEMIDAETHVYGQTETCHDYCNFDIKQTTATKNDIPFLEGDCLIERYNVLELTKRLNDAETLKARIRAEFKFLESNSVKVDIPINDYEIVLKENQTGEPTKELKTLYIKQSAEDIFVFSSLPDDDNIEQFWSMIINYNIENIIMIVQKNEKTTSFYPTQDDVFKVAMLEIEMRSAEKTNDNIFMLRFILHDKNTRKKHHVKIFKTNWDDSDKYPSVESICTLLEKVKIEEGRPTLMTGSKGKCFSVCGSVSLCLQSVRAIERETTFSLLEYATLLKRIEDDFIKVFDDYVFCYKVMTQYLETVHTYSFIE